MEGWKVASKLGVPLVDEHYYQPAGWFLNNHDYYDRYELKTNEAVNDWSDLLDLLSDERLALSDKWSSWRQHDDR